MGSKVEQWGPEKFKKELADRLKRAKKKRERFEDQWRINERTVFYHNSRNPNSVTITEDGLLRTDAQDAGSNGGDETEMAVNYAWKFLRFIHSQMSANPPSVMARPTSSDQEDAQKADAADRICRWAYGQFDFQEIFDMFNLKCLTYGTSFIRTYWDAALGDAFHFDDKTQMITMQGETCVYSPSTWDIWLDPNAKSQRDLRYFFERIEFPIDEAKFRWPQYEQLLERETRTKPKNESELVDWRAEEGIVEVFRYIEKGLPINGMAGRMAYHLEDGTLLGEPTKNTNPDQKLGLAMETDIDLPDEVYGVSFLQYISKLQELLNRLDSNFVDNVAAHNVVRMVLPDGAEIEEESLSNSSWDYVKITGNSGNGPYFVPAASLMPDAHKLRENLITGIQELAGVNDSAQGVQKREMSGFSMQTAIDAGNTVRRRLFNKNTLAVKAVYVDFLANAKEHWNDPRTILILGKENAFESAEFRGADIDGGFDITCEYGASLSLDPARRREEIMQLMPVFEKAGVPTKTVLSMLKLNQLEPLYDRMTLAASRQREIIEEIVTTAKQVAPRDLQDHAGMLDFCYFYVMTSTYKYLPSEVKDLIDQHIKTREQMAAQAAQKGKANPATAAAGAGAPAPGQEQLNNPQSAQADAGGIAPIPTGLPSKVLAQGNAGPAVAAAS